MDYRVIMLNLCGYQVFILMLGKKACSNFLPKIDKVFVQRQFTD